MVDCGRHPHGNGSLLGELWLFGEFGAFVDYFSPLKTDADSSVDSSVYSSVDSSGDSSVDLSSYLSLDLSAPPGLWGCFPVSSAGA